jgi:peptide/nickel transport system permease protein
MSLFILRRLGQSVLTILGVMTITFLLFRVISGDVAAANLGEKATARQKADWRHSHGYDLPSVVNLHRQLLLADKTVPHVKDAPPLDASDLPGSRATQALALILATADESEPSETPQGGRKDKRQNVLMGRYVFRLSRDTSIARLTDGEPLVEAVRPAPPPEQPAGEPPATAPSTSAATTSGASPAASPSTPAASPSAASSASGPGASGPGALPPRPPPPPEPLMKFTLGDKSTLIVNLAGVQTCGDVTDRINNAPGNNGRLEAGISDWSFSQAFDSQFFHHLWNSVRFEARSLKDNRKLTEIIAQHAPYSLAITIPAMALEWMLGLAVACFVAYYRGSLADKIGVFLSVLGMCIPFLGFMILGQWLMFKVLPEHAYGISNRANVYLPIAIMVAAGLGGMVRFYRTVILDETNRDYVRTAKAKGVPLPTILFKHVLRNCMLPILTSLILSIPFLIMGSLLVETYFGINGLGDLMISSIQNRDEPVMNCMVFLTALIYTIGVLLTDISYAVFDPRIRLK